MISQHDFSGSVTLCSGEDRRVNKCEAMFATQNSKRQVAVQTFIIALNQQICCISFLFANCEAA